MYIPRAGLEEKLVRALEQSKHIVVHGESGCGKSWLYKKVFSDRSVHWRTANLGRASSGGGIEGLLRQVLAQVCEKQLTEIVEGKAASVKALVAEGGVSHERTYQLRTPDSFQTLLSEIRREAGRSKTCALVFENLEHIVSDEALLKEFKGLLLLVDDQDYAQFDVKIVLVTTASDLRNYLAKVDHANTVTNRLHEIPEVARLVPKQADQFVKKGLFQLLGISVANRDEKLRNWIVDWVLCFSDRIPQYLHELCLEIAQGSEASGRMLTEDLVKKSTLDWLRSSLISEMTAVTSNLNSISTKKGRKNQLLYAIANCDQSEFDYQKIENIVRANFPLACENIKLSVSQGLSELASAKMPLIRRVPHGTSYRITDPRYRILMRWVLAKVDDSEALVIRPFDQAISL